MPAILLVVKGGRSRLWWFENVFAWADLHSGAVVAILTLIYSVATIFIYLANKAAVQEMRLEREEAMSPFVTCGLEINYGRGTVELVVRNIGKTPAYNVRITSDPPLGDQPFLHKSITDAMMFTKGLPTLQPGEQFRVFLGIWHNVKPDKNGNLPTFRFRASYEGLNRKRREVESISDLNAARGISFLHTKGTHELVGEVEKLRKELESLRRVWEKLEGCFQTLLTSGDKDGKDPHS